MSNTRLYFKTFYTLGNSKEAHNLSCLRYSERLPQSVKIFGAMSFPDVDPNCFIKFKVSTGFYHSTSCSALRTSPMEILVLFFCRIWLLTTHPKVPIADLIILNKYFAQHMDILFSKWIFLHWKINFLGVMEHLNFLRNSALLSHYSWSSQLAETLTSSLCKMSVFHLFN